MEDLMKYILPCGIGYRIIEETVQDRGSVESYIEVSDFYYIDSEEFSSDLLIGHNKGTRKPTKTGRVNYITDTYVYDNVEGKKIPDFNSEGRR